MLSDQILEYLSKVNRYVDERGNITFYLKDASIAEEVKSLINKWYFDRGGYGPWIKDGDHWDHTHRDGIRFHHPSKGCPELT